MASPNLFDWSEVNGDLQQKMTKCVDSVKTKYATIRTNGAHPSMLDRVYINYFGSHQPLNQLAHIKITSPNEIFIEPHDLSLIKDIEQGILYADLNISPINDGKSIRIKIPPLTEERRKELAKIAKQLNEEGKISLRNVRRETIEKIRTCEKGKQISKDDSKNYQVRSSVFYSLHFYIHLYFYEQECTQKVTEDFVKKLDTLFKLKEKDLLSM